VSGGCRRQRCEHGLPPLRRPRWCCWRLQPGGGTGPAPVTVSSPHPAAASVGGLRERAQALVWRLVSELSPPPGTRTVHLAKLPPPLTNPPPPVPGGWARAQRTLEARRSPGPPGRGCGTASRFADAATLDAVEEIVSSGAPDPVALRRIDWELAPFYCPDCGLNYCRADWDTFPLFDEGFYDCTIGICLHGQRHTVDD
jgi:hypothetical protein